MKRILFVLFLITFSILPVIILANGLKVAPGPWDLPQVGQKITKVFYPIAATITVVMFVIAGILFLTAAGNPEQISKAKKAFFWGVIGVAVILIGSVIDQILGQIFGF